MLWPELEDRRLKDPDRQLLDAIAAGELDEHLVAIADAVGARQELLHTVRSAKAIAEFCVGDTVMFTNRIRPRYLEGELAPTRRFHDAASRTVHGASGKSSPSASPGPIAAVLPSAALSATKQVRRESSRRATGAIRGPRNPR